MIEPSEHAEKRSAVEELLRKLPGFRGYLEKEYRRQSDDLQRQWLAGRLERSKRAIQRVTQSLADAGCIDILPQVDLFRGRVDHLIARIRGAMEGYSGFFDLVQVDEALLEDVYQHDLALMDQVEALAQAIEKLPEDAEAIAGALPGLRGQVAELEREWDVRADMLQGLQ
ncbi:MAG TPA: hypothetical protein EYP56_00620 [Planctomycetaceae bacterium]|nr:hypothetical protein [Planctomycetaceae bacterium]